MPTRKQPLINGCYYHVFNRGVNKQPVFFTSRNYKRAVSTFSYYKTDRPPIKYSQFKSLSSELKEVYLKSLKQMPNGVEIISFMLMPNHYHFLLLQVEKDGIKNFIRNFQISYTKYINIKVERVGPLFQGQFKSFLVEDEFQLIHLNRYIHLNPYTSHILSNLNELVNYSWSSLSEYLTNNKYGICNKEVVLSHFSNIDMYKKFLFDQADYQKQLEYVKHLTMEN